MSSYCLSTNLLKENFMKYQLLILILLGLSLAPLGAGACADDISGTWVFSITLEGGLQTAPLTFVFKQEGEKLTGNQGENKATGTVKGKKVEFIVEGKNRRGEPYKNSYAGTIESPTKMTGTAEFPKGSGMWTASKK
jgi:hypothetical protein